jgi:hypothetical protein
VKWLLGGRKDLFTHSLTKNAFPAKELGLKTRGGGRQESY